MDKHRIVRFIIFLCATLGFVYQLQSTLIGYFRHQTITRTSNVYHIDSMSVMSISICLPYVDILDYERLYKERKLKLNKLARKERFNALQDIVTVRDIFDFTPDSQSIISSCSLRINSPRVMTFLSDRVECNKQLTIKKYFSQEFMCYAVQPDQVELPYNIIFTTIDSPNTVYSVYLNKTVSSKLTFNRLIVHSNTSLPRISKRYSELINVNRKSDLTVKYTKVFVELLGYPYDKFTCNSNSAIYTTCLEECSMGKSIQMFDRVLYDIDTVKRYSYKVISYKQSSKVAISDSISDILSSCKGQCNIFTCKFDYAITSFKVNQAETYAISLLSPASPYMWTVFMPRLELLDLFVYVMGAVGAWFGISFISFDSVLLAKLFTKHETTTVVIPKWRRQFIREMNGTVRMQYILDK